MQRRDLAPVAEHEGQRRQHGAQPLHGERAMRPAQAADGGAHLRSPRAWLFSAKALMRVCPVSLR